ncbi:hypothetical protein T069G_02410 [Trichoderma breve]|uniref:Uncharacterized protein n=1 Tax=Trichoderma breve TaxID=2034170 RepID=A0A9W9EA32_9HYPO|nr:hypothetical protein T069G_02410 [Trichoderma breve]KAJ4861456.1 hypothetical protein T069G_02410 [Trichoderma breve]
MAPTVVMSVAPSQPPQQQQVLEDTTMAETPAVVQIQAERGQEEEQQETIVNAVEAEVDEDQMAFEADLDNI